MYLNTGTKHSIRKVEDLGQIIILDDGSRWKVSMFDKSKSMMWIPLDEVTIQPSGIIYKLTHLKRKETVEAEQTT